VHYSMWALRARRDMPNTKLAIIAGLIVLIFALLATCWQEIL
jgi:hypothetical protein